MSARAGVQNTNAQTFCTCFVSTSATKYQNITLFSTSTISSFTSNFCEDLHLQIINFTGHRACDVSMGLKSPILTKNTKILLGGTFLYG